MAYEQSLENNLMTDEWNDSLKGRFLWSNTNFGEAVTEVMTPLTWSVIQFSLDDWVFVPGFSTVGNIGGYPYLNISVFASLFLSAGRSRQDLLNTMEATLYMRLPEELDIPRIPLSPGKLLSSLFHAMRIQSKQRRGVRELPAYLEANPAWFQEMRARIQAEGDTVGLRTLWQKEIRPHIKHGVWCVLGSVTHSADFTIRLRRELSRLVGPDDANVLIANLSDSSGLLASLGPVAGLAKVARGELSREAYLEQYGHRGPHEFEISMPRPVEDPEWLDQELANLRQSPVDIAALMAKQQAAFEAAWKRLQSRYPRQAGVMGRRIAESARRARWRELARSEYTRDRWTVRLFALRAGELTGMGPDIFFLTLDEVLGLLAGDGTPAGAIPARKEAYLRHKSLPSYPAVICGRFDPYKYAADPQRRSDLFVEDAMPETIASEQGESDVILGSPGSAGQVEGVVRCLVSPEQGSQLREGEILVAVQTDIAWTMLFPRAAAVVTDVGAPLSHAAIVARELGIPAVVGCGDATRRLKTGDRVRVDGGQGRVMILGK